MDTENKTEAPKVVSTDASPPPTTEQQKEEPALIDMCKALVFSSKINVLYAAVPIAILCGVAGGPSWLNFTTAFLGLIPLAAVLGDLTEDLALYYNDAIGALINVTFGNATELIISIAALRLEQYNLIKQSLAGSVLGNMLLVLGTSLVIGGIKNPMLKFNTHAAQTYMASLILASFAFIVPSAFGTINDNMTFNVLTNSTSGEKAIEMASKPQYALRVSQEMSLVMILIYVLYIYFQLKTHKHLFDGAEDENNREGGEEEEEEEPQFTKSFGILGIAVVAVLISILSDIMVDSVEGAADSLHISKHFIGLVLVPIVGNVAEHASAVIMAGKGKLDISLGVALGSSIQIAMFAMPVMVVISWLGGFSLDMKFTPFVAATMFASVVLTYAVVSDGNATWLSGGKLLAAYLILVVAFLNTPDHIDEV